MPMYWGDYLKDTMHFDALEHGAYILLIAHCWMNDGKAPNETRKLLQITKLKGMKGALERLDSVLKKFELVGNDWTHKRVMHELSRAREKKQKAKESGRLGGAARQANAKAIAKATPIAKRKRNESSSPSPSILEDNIPLPPSLESVRPAVENWIAYKLETHNFRYKPRGLKALFAELQDYGPDIAAASIQFSIARGYQGIVKREPEKSQKPTLSFKNQRELEVLARIQEREKHEQNGSIRAAQGLDGAVHGGGRRLPGRSVDDGAEGRGPSRSATGGRATPTRAGEIIPTNYRRISGGGATPAAAQRDSSAATAGVNIDDEGIALKVN